VGPAQKIVAVVVAYQPDPAALARLLRALAPQVATGCVVHNGSSLPDADPALQDSGFAVLHLGSNKGVASALNAGFFWAQAQQADYVISFDQDSEPAPDMVARLLRACSALQADGHRVGAVGPQQIDPQGGTAAAFIAPVFGPRQRLFPRPGEALEVDHLISSGCLVPMAAWRDAGTLLDALFIDYVDIEWCLRLRHRGWRLYGVGGAQLMHRIGEGVQKLGRRQVAWHGPLRHYYLFRNGIHLQKLPHIGLAWKLSDALQLLKKFVFFSLVARPRGAHLRAMLRGMRDGWRGRLGPADGAGP